MLLLPGNLSALTRLASKDAGRFIMNSVHLQETPDGYQLVATDGRRLGIVTGPGRQDELDQQLVLAPNGAPAALVSAKDLATILKRASKEPCRATLGFGQAAFAIDNTVSVLPVEEGKYPDVAGMIRSTCRSILTMHFNAKLLAELLLVAAEFGSDSTGHKVTLHYSRKDRPLLVTTSNGEGQVFEGAIMPLT